MLPNLLGPRQPISKADREMLIAKLAKTRSDEQVLKETLAKQGIDSRRGLPARVRHKEV